MVSLADDAVFETPSNIGGHASGKPSFARVLALDARARLRRLGRRRMAVYGIAAVLSLLCFARFGLTGRALIGVFFVTTLVFLSAIDVAERRLPNRIVLPAAAIVLLAQVVVDPERTLECAVAAVGAACFLALPALVRPGTMGMGDVKLALLLGAGLGAAVVPGLLLGMIAAGLFSLVLVARSGLGARTQFIAFGPFLAFGAIAAYFLG